MPIAKEKIEQFNSDYFIFSNDTEKTPTIEKITITELVNNETKDVKYHSVIKAPQEIAEAVRNNFTEKKDLNDSTEITVHSSTPTLASLAAQLKDFLPANGIAISRTGPYYETVDGRIYHTYMERLRLNHRDILVLESDQGIEWYHNPNTPITRENLLSKEQMQAILDKDPRYLSIFGKKPAAANDGYDQVKRTPEQIKGPNVPETAPEPKSPGI